MNSEMIELSQSIMLICNMCFSSGCRVGSRWRGDRISSGQRISDPGTTILMTIPSPGTCKTLRRTPRHLLSYQKHPRSMQELSPIK